MLKMKTNSWIYRTFGNAEGMPVASTSRLFFSAIIETSLLLVIAVGTTLLAYIAGAFVLGISLFLSSFWIENVKTLAVGFLFCGLIAGSFLVAINLLNKIIKFESPF